MKTREKIKTNNYWQFYKGNVEGAENVGYNDTNWETVHLPHTPQIEDIDVVRHFQGICWYRKKLTPDPMWKGKKLFIEFEAAMQVADVWVNGKHITTHYGGYLPFIIDISDIDFDSENIIAVRLDNSDNADVPPGKPLGKLDFCYFGGLYRNVWLHVLNDVHISNAVYANKPASGGVFVRYENVNGQSADVVVETHVVNYGDKENKVTLQSVLVDAKGNVVCTTKSNEKNNKRVRRSCFFRSFAC